MDNTQNMFLDWNDAITNDGLQFLILEEGDYNFTVTAFERGRFPGSDKLPACNKASLTLTVQLPNGQTATCREDLLLYRTLEWKLASFFRAIGQKKDGESMVMDWTKVVGAHGRAHFKPRPYTTNGTDHITNSVERYYDYDEQVAQQDWVRDAQRAEVSGTAAQMPQQTPYQQPQQTPYLQPQQMQYQQYQQPQPYQQMPMNGGWKGGQF